MSIYIYWKDCRLSISFKNYCQWKIHRNLTPFACQRIVVLRIIRNIFRCYFVRYYLLVNTERLMNNEQRAWPYCRLWTANSGWPEIFIAFYLTGWRTCGGCFLRHVRDTRWHQAGPGFDKTRAGNFGTCYARVMAPGDIDVAPFYPPFD